MKNKETSIKICKCINWHPSIKPNMGKKARCSHCGRLRHAVKNLITQY